MKATEENKKRIQCSLDNPLIPKIVEEDSRGFFILILGKEWRPQEEERTDPWVMTGAKEYQEKIDKIQRLEEEVAAQVVLIDAYVAKAKQEGEDVTTIIVPVDELHKKGKEIAQLRHRLTREIRLRSKAFMESEEYKREIIGLRKTLNNLRAEQAKQEIGEGAEDTEKDAENEDINET